MVVVEGRLWRPAAQRSVRNAWSYIQGHRLSWSSASAAALSAATDLVNSYLSHGDVDAMDFGVLADMEGLKDKTRRKLYLNQKKYLHLYLSSYEEMVQSVLGMTSSAASMKTYFKDSGGGLITFTNTEATVEGDSGDGGGVPVFATLPLAAHELLALEVTSMFQKELRVKWLLASEFCKLVYPNSAECFSIKSKLSSPDCCQDISRIITPAPEEERKRDVVKALKSMNLEVKPPKRETLQVYLTSLLAEVYINKDRLEEIWIICKEEMSVGLFSSP